MGYELINEPFPGDIYTNPLLLLPGVGDRKNLQPFYNRINQRIRQIDDNHIIFYEPITWDLTPVGFTEVPGGSNYQNRSVLSWHYYCWSFDSDMNPIRWGLCELEKEDMFTFRSRDVERLGGAGFLTEFGLCDGSTNSSKYECTNVMDKADADLFSWTYWDYSDGNFYNSDGSPKDYQIQEFSRTYARAITGQVISMSFHSETSIFNLQFAAFILPNNPPTEIYLNEKYRYPKGYHVSISPPNSATHTSQQPNLIYISLDLTEVSVNQTITVQIIPL